MGLIFQLVLYERTVNNCYHNTLHITLNERIAYWAKWTHGKYTQFAYFEEKSADWSLESRYYIKHSHTRAHARFIDIDRESRSEYIVREFVLFFQFHMGEGGRGYPDSKKTNKNDTPTTLKSVYLYPAKFNYNNRQICISQWLNHLIHIKLLQIEAVFINQCSPWTKCAKPATFVSSEMTLITVGATHNSIEIE